MDMGGKSCNGGAAFTAFMVIVMSNMGFWATLAADMPSLSRFLKHQRRKGIGLNEIKHSY